MTTQTLEQKKLHHIRKYLQIALENLDKVTPAGKERLTTEALQHPELSPQDKLDLVTLNQDNKLSIISRVQRHTLEHLFTKNEQFFTSRYHYDWWSFPMHVPAAWNWPKRNYEASITLAEAQTLLNDPEYVETYLNGVKIYLNALKKNEWNDYPVRYARMLHSLSLFLHAAKSSGSMKEIHARLLVQGTESLHYAIEHHLLQRYADYPLFMQGARSVQQALPPDTVLEEESKTTPTP